VDRLVRVALAVALVTGAAACSGDGRPAAVSGPSSPTASHMSAPDPALTGTPAPAPGVTLGEARQVLGDVLAADDVARAAGDERLALDLSRDAPNAITAATYRASAMAPPRYTWGRQTLMVPRLVTYPYWFTAAVERRDVRGRTRTAVLVLLRDSEKSRWRIDFSALLDSGQEPPSVRLDADGYATALATRDESVMISPHLMGPLHATIAEEGVGGFAAGLVAPGAHTTGYFTQIAADRQLAKDRDCMNYDSIFAATTYPVYALRTPDGGAVVLYSLNRTTTWSPVLKCGEGKRLEIPAGARWLLKDPVVLKERRIVEMQQYVSVVPAKNAPTTAQIIGFDGVITKATAH
jgi:hypothetical protein